MAFFSSFSFFATTAHYFMIIRTHLGMLVYVSCLMKMIIYASWLFLSCINRIASLGNEFETVSSSTYKIHLKSAFTSVGVIPKQWCIMNMKIILFVFIKQDKYTWKVTRWSDTTFYEIEFISKLYASHCLRNCDT